MIIKPICPVCGNKVVVDVKTIDMLKSRVKELEELNEKLQLAMNLSDSLGDVHRGNRGSEDLFDSFFGDK